MLGIELSLKPYDTSSRDQPGPDSLVSGTVRCGIHQVNMVFSYRWCGFFTMCWSVR